MKSPWISKILTWLFVGLILFFLGKTLYVNINQIYDYTFKFNFAWLMLSFAVYGLGFVVLSSVFYVLLRKMGHHVPFFANLEYLLYGQFGSYIPGKIWLYVIRYRFLKKHNVTETHFGTLFAIEAVQMIGSAAVLSVIFASQVVISNNWYIVILLGLLACIFVGLYPRIFYPVANWLYRLIRRPTIPAEQHVPYKYLLLTFGLVSGYWIILAVAFYFFAISFLPILQPHFILVMGAFISAYWLGLVALFAPSGLGVREGIFVYVFSTIVAGPVAIIIAVATRVWGTLNEIVWAGVGFLALRNARIKIKDGTDTPSILTAQNKDS